MGPFWNQSGTDPKLDLLFYMSSFGSIWIRSAPVPERFSVNRSQSGPVQFGTVPVLSHVNVPLDPRDVSQRILKEALSFTRTFIIEKNDNFLSRLTNKNSKKNCDQESPTEFFLEPVLK